MWPYGARWAEVYVEVVKEVLVQAVILAGGLGSRLHPYTMNIPKPLLPLGDKPVLEIVVRQLAAAGFSEVIVTTGFLGHLIEAFLGDGSEYGLRIRYHREQVPLGTAAPLRELAGLGEDFLVLNGDLLTTMDFMGLLTEHQRGGSWATIAATRRRVHIDYGVVHTDADGMLLRYEEKPTIEYAVSMGIYALSRRVLDLLPAEGRYDMPDLLREVEQAGQPVRCHTTDVYWQDIGRFDDYGAASEDFTADPSRFLPEGR